MTLDLPTSPAVPKLTLGLPVYNGARYLAAALDSLLAQTYTDFELLISDNGSTDATAQICRAYAARDARIRYVRYETNRGPAWNHNNVVELARGEYFKWCAADDLHHPDMLRRCVEVLDRDPSVVLAYPRARRINDAGEFTGDCGIRGLRTDAASPAVRFAALINVNHKLHGVLECFGVMRRAPLLATGLFAYVARGDSLCLARLVLRGRFQEIPEPLFYNRDHPQRSVKREENVRKRGHTPMARLLGGGPVPPAEWWNPAMAGKISFPEWRLAWEYFTSVARSGLPFTERLACYGRLLGFLLRHTPKLARDLILAAEWFALGILRRKPPRDQVQGRPTTTSA